MDTVLSSQIESVRAAFAAGALPADKHAGAAACRTLLALLETQPGQPLVGASPPAVVPLASALGQLGQLNADQVLDLVILKLRTMVPSGDRLATAAGGFHLPALPLPGGGAR